MGDNETANGNTVSIETALSKTRALKSETTLPSGKILKIYKGKGRDSVQALKDADNDGTKYLVCLMAALVEVDGAQMVPEALEDLDLEDFMKIQTEFASQNF